MVLFVFGCDAKFRKKNYLIPYLLFKIIQLLHIELAVESQINANFANGDNFSFTIVDEGSKGKLGNLNPTKTVT